MTNFVTDFGEELLWNYGPGFELTDDEEEVVVNDEERFMFC